jgi:hypothetical protein
MCCFCYRPTTVAEGYVEIDVTRPERGDAPATEQRLWAHARCLEAAVSDRVPLYVVAADDVSP